MIAVQHKWKAPLVRLCLSHSSILLHLFVPFAANMQFSCSQTRELFGKKFTIVLYQGKQYLIGVQIAHYLKRETFNLYRSMKLGNIDVIKCVPEQVEELAQLEAVKRGIHSVTLIPVEAGITYMNREMKRKPRKKNDKKSRHSTRLHEVGSLSVSHRFTQSTPLSMGTRAALVAAVAATSANVSAFMKVLPKEEMNVSPVGDDDSSHSDAFSCAEDSGSASASSSGDEQADLWSRLLLVAAMEHVRETGPPMPAPAPVAVHSFETLCV